MTKATQPLRYTLVITGPAYGTQNSYLAYQFATALIQSNHIINTVFFYGDGVYNGNRFVRPANDEFDIIKAWQTLSEQYNIPLEICISAAARRGITEKNLAEHFCLSGLSVLSDSVANSNRTIQF